MCALKFPDGWPAVFNIGDILVMEANFTSLSKRRWIAEHKHVVLYYVGLYLALIFSIRIYMKSCPPLKLRGIFITWNTLLSIFSIVAFCRMFSATYIVYQEFGFKHLICNIEEDSVSGFWGWMGVLIKILELGDTLFIVLRKRQLIFLHWYHHVTVLLYVWYSYSEDAAPMRWFCLMNYFVHSLMYPYYTLRALRVSVPIVIPLIITTTQIIQMIIGIHISYFAYVVRHQGHFCQFSELVALGGIAMYASYFILFLHFFYNKYLAPKRKMA